MQSQPLSQRVLMTAARLWLRYVILLERRPMLVKACTSASMLGLEEAVVQLLLAQAKPARALRMALYGFAVSGPLGHVLYGAVNRACQSLREPLASVAQLVAINGAVVPIQSAVYLFALALLSGASPAKALRSMRAELWPMVLTAWKYFPIIQIFTIRYLPEQLWLPFFNLIGLLYGIYSNYTVKRRTLRASCRTVPGATVSPGTSPAAP